MKVVDVHLIHRSTAANVIRRPMHITALHPAASHARTECLGVVIAPRRLTLTIPVPPRRPPEFPAPDHKCAVQQSPLLQIF